MVLLTTWAQTKWCGGVFHCLAKLRTAGWGFGKNVRDTQGRTWTCFPTSADSRMPGWGLRSTGRTSCRCFPPLCSPSRNSRAAKSALFAPLFRAKWGLLPSKSGSFWVRFAQIKTRLPVFSITYWLRSYYFCIFCNSQFLPYPGPPHLSFLGRAPGTACDTLSALRP